ncbi:MAG: preprotein translocase subunit SecY, partial [Deltaproteobacteria bacterium]|nr:preprotein translocase subunit SecY [Deltaproteobacteria bacterium]
MFEALINSFRIPDLRKKMLFTLGFLGIYRIGTYIPTPGIDGQALSQFFKNLSQGPLGALFGLMNMFSGGAMDNCTIFALGVMPYISASIIMQLLVAVVPYLEKLAKEGDMGRKKINQYTRYGTIVLCLIQSLMISAWLQDPKNFQGVQIVRFPGLGFSLLTMITLTTGTSFIMWLGEQITAHGIGNGMSLIITAGIISRMPTAGLYLFELLSGRQLQPYVLLIMAVMFVAVVVAVILITQGQRKIPVQYAKRIIGRKVYGGQSTYIPLRVNMSGVIPIIFAQSIFLFIGTLSNFSPIPALKTFALWLTRGQVLYTLAYTVLILVFTYFYTAIIFNPVDVAENMKKYGGFIPGIRPGKPTSEYFDFILSRITLPGAIFLAVIAVLPDLIGKSLKIPYLIASFFGGTALLIIV